MESHTAVVQKTDLLAAAQGIGLSGSEAEKLWLALRTSSPDSPKSKMPRVFYFLGTLVVCLALAWFMGDRYTLYGTAALLPISLSYATCFAGAGLYLWKAKRKETLGGLGIFLSLSLVPLITYAIQDLTGWWPGQFPGQYSDFFTWIKGGWAIMELVTIGAALTALHFIKFPLLTLPLYVALWFMSMDIAPVFSRLPVHLMQIRITFCILLGLALMVNAVFLDRRQKTAFAFWGHLFGIAIFWSGITCLTFINYTGGLEDVFYCLLNISLIVLSPILRRRVYLVFGTIGLLSTLFLLAHTYFADSPSFPLILSGVGLLVIIAGVIVQRNWTRIPTPLQRRDKDAG